MNLEELWNKAVTEHNAGEYHEAHELFEDLWMDLDNRTEKDIVQTLAQADALAIHMETGNIRAAQRLMRQLPELLQTFPSKYRNINLKEMKDWVRDMILNIPLSGDISKEQIDNPKPPKLAED